MRILHNLLEQHFENRANSFTQDERFLHFRFGLCIKAIEGSIVFRRHYRFVRKVFFVTSVVSLDLEF